MLKQKTGNTVLCSKYNDIQYTQPGNCHLSLMKCYFKNFNPSLEI